ncbi:hypothetical protein AQUCO_02000122v1 [Aquilegia coerulea]|uniref:Phospholipase D alpha 1 n=1 Tax=Aquilegia coerulea TaxID=218851 RepID=A0A2G5DG08_AQUCA|nr:hypothetical protein AQUCO_02000122v1 [Aquilegia coerulea]
MALILLHGTLHVTIFEATSLTNPDRATGDAPKFIRKKCDLILFILIKQNIEEAVGIGKGATQLYTTIDLERGRVGRTRLIDEPANPRWYESFHIYCAHLASNIVFSIKVANPIGATLIGRAYLPVKELLNGQEVDRWLEILDTDRKPLHGGPRIHVKLQFFDVSLDPNWSRGIQSPKYPGVPYTYFTQRHGCRVSLYQDAHVPDNYVPKIPLAGGKYYEPHRCWEDIFDAITNAKHLIYITGWSVYPEFALIRDSRRPKPGGDITLGELLKKKASEGIRVLMLVWDDRFSGDLSKDGVMGTHDEETANYFQGTDVHCVLCPRNPDNGGSFIKNIEIATMFTHHQKIVVVDSEVSYGSSERRRIVSYVGGIDLCDGRYDTQFHSLFRTLDTAHHDDFHQPNFTGASISKGGPREPWHDIHSRLEGPVAWDVLDNFEQRWRKQGGKDLLVQLRDLADIIMEPSPVTLPDDHETWNVQVFRSIDGGAAFGFPNTPEAAAKVGLMMIGESFFSVFNVFLHVDDEYIIIGSANINQRSMDGARDSEIAMGAYQPYHLSNNEPARGQIHGFRMSLWYEHLGMLDDSLLNPESLECIQKVNSIASKYWDLYSSDTLEHDLPGHLLSYPIGVASDGMVTQLPGFEFFPDTKGRVLGTISDLYPPILTT